MPKITLPPPLLNREIYRQQDDGMAVGRCMTYSLFAIRSFLYAEFYASPSEIRQEIDSFYRTLSETPREVDLKRLCLQNQLAVEVGGLPAVLESGQVALLKLAWNKVSLDRIARKLGRPLNRTIYDQIKDDGHDKEDARHFVWIYAIEDGSYCAWDSFFGGPGGSPIWKSTARQLRLRHSLLEQLNFPDDASFMGHCYLIRKKQI